MDAITLARVLHVLGVVLWIGGVAMVTMVLLPMVARMNSVSEGLDFFNQFRRRFAAQARLSSLLVGLSGFYMLYALDVWHRFSNWHYWWMHSMVLIWLIFTIMLFILEPRARNRRQKSSPGLTPEKKLARIQRMHWILLTLSVTTIAGAVAGSHGWHLFGNWP